MTSQEIYNQYFIDEEYNLYDAPVDVYSYRCGWNCGLRRAAIVITNEIRPKAKSYIKQPSGWEYCSICNKVLEPQDKFCWNCGAEITREKEE